MNETEEELRKQLRSLQERVEKLESQIVARSEKQVKLRPPQCYVAVCGPANHNVRDPYINHHNFIYCRERHSRTEFFCRFCGVCTLCVSEKGKVRRGWVDPNNPNKPCPECSHKESELCTCVCPVHYP